VRYSSAALVRSPERRIAFACAKSAAGSDNGAAPTASPEAAPLESDDEARKLEPEEGIAGGSANLALDPRTGSAS
jgi:hypothetical protein